MIDDQRGGTVGISAQPMAKRSTGCNAAQSPSAKAASPAATSGAAQRKAIQAAQRRHVMGRRQIKRRRAVAKHQQCRRRRRRDWRWPCAPAMPCEVPGRATGVQDGKEPRALSWAGWAKSPPESRARGRSFVSSSDKGEEIDAGGGALGGDGGAAAGLVGVQRRGSRRRGRDRPGPSHRPARRAARAPRSRP